MNYYVLIRQDETFVKQMNYYVPIQQDETSIKHSDKPHYTSRILGRRFALTSTAYKYLDIKISVRPVLSVELLVGDNRRNQIILPHATSKAFIERCADIEQLLQSTAASSVSIQDLVIL